jgi:hypothetical protein
MEPFARGDIMKKLVTALVMAASLAVAAVATSGSAEARWGWGGGWGWRGGWWGPGLGFAAGALVGGAIASSYYYPYGYYGYYGGYGPYSPYGYGGGCGWRTYWNGYAWVRACY